MADSLQVRKQTISSDSETISPPEMWLDLRELTLVEVSSESADHPVEEALIPDRGPGWQAAQPGKQIIRLIFDQPCTLRRIILRFEERQRGRTQEFVLRWLSKNHSRREIVRQQYTFSPPGTHEEVEDYYIKLDGVIALELEIIPDISGGSAHASLAMMRLA